MHDISTHLTPSTPQGWTLQLCMHHMQGQRWQYQQPFHQPVEQIPSSTTRLTHLNFQQELLRDASPLLVQVTSWNQSLLLALAFSIHCNQAL